MKKVALLFAVAVMFVSVVASATSFDGTYTFMSRTKDGKADMAGWWGIMVITNNTMTRIYHSPDGKTEKYYAGPYKQEGDVYTVTFNQAYKPDYVGNIHKQKMNVSGNKLTLASPDGAFQEIWTKK